MSLPSPSTPAPGPAIRSQVVTESVGATVVGALGLLLGVLALGTGAALLGSASWAGGLTLLLGVGLLALVWKTALRGSHPLLLTLTRESLQLAPTGRSVAQGIKAETIPLASIVAYKHWLQVSRARVFAQYYLRLELADGRVLRLADRPGVLPDDYPPGAVRLNEVAARLACWARPGTVARPLFYATPLARALCWACGAAALGAPVLLWRGYLTVGYLLLSGAISYLGSYYLGRGTADITAPPK
ncbi:hypothetical protein [Hymenobacter psoromatis]|uniref:hypothetical protein n=1 Tax=Hymenobacter psoromatis TaxID=1484116 RepID=UPI001CBBB92B|nr:hypothetical protein [Hymenobacter psoromatis]